MFFFEVERLINAEDIDKAIQLLRWARRRSKRLAKDLQFKRLCTQLDVII